MKLKTVICLTLGLVLVLALDSRAGDQRTIPLNAFALAGLKRTSIRAQIHHTDQPADYEGMPLGDLVRKFGAPAGEAIRAARLSTIVVVKASDGCKSVFALPELDPAFTKKEILVADRRNGDPLSDKEGPYRLIVPDENRQARWVRQVVSIEIRQVE